jgi:hypothetical protein
LRYAGYQFWFNQLSPLRDEVVGDNVFVRHFNRSPPVAKGRLPPPAGNFIPKQAWTSCRNAFGRSPDALFLWSSYPFVCCSPASSAVGMGSKGVPSARDESMLQSRSWAWIRSAARQIARPVGPSHAAATCLRERHISLRAYASINMLCTVQLTLYSGYDGSIRAETVHLNIRCTAAGACRSV